MKINYHVDCICRGVVSYLRAFGLADNMEVHQENGIEWLSPKPGFFGPSLVYHVTLDESMSESRIEQAVADIKAGKVPSFWFMSPDFTPANIADILLSKGFKDLSNPEEPELAMALDMAAHPEWPEPNRDIETRKVQTGAEFEVWCDIANEVLHGSPMVTPEHYSRWVFSDDISLYLVELKGIPVATAATIRYGDAASLEFVATLKEHRCKGAGTAACVKALEDLQHSGVKVVTLRAFQDGAPIYTKLGFKSYYTTVGFCYPMDSGNPS